MEGYFVPNSLLFLVLGSSYREYPAFAKVLLAEVFKS